jgi:hypothetical protein
VKHRVQPPPLSRPVVPVVIRQESPVHSRLPLLLVIRKAVQAVYRHPARAIPHQKVQAANQAVVLLKVQAWCLAAILPDDPRRCQLQTLLLVPPAVQVLDQLGHLLTCHRLVRPGSHPKVQAMVQANCPVPTLR